MNTYTTYQPTNITWLGDIPSHWELSIGMTVLKENKRSNKGMKENTVLSLSYGEIIIKDESKLFGLVPESFETYQIVELNDIIIRCTDLQNDKTSLRTGLAKNKGIITSAYLNLGIKQGFNPKFIHYYLHTLDITKVFYGLGSGLRQNLSYLDFKRLPMAIPPLSEQIAIAEFLDKKTAQIQTAIRLKSEQIDRLKEYRQALINECVTKGLNPNAVLKNSGVVWLGDIPNHWELKKLKYFGFIYAGLNGKSGDDFSKEFKENQNLKPFIPFTNICNNKIIDTNNYQFVKINEFEKQNNIIKNDILFLMSSETLEDIAKSSLYLGNDKELYLNSFCKAFRITNDKLSPIFLNYIFLSQTYRGYFSTVARGFTRINLKQEYVNNLFLPIPPLTEQTAIAEFLDKKTAQIDTALATYQAQIDKLNEYQRSLVNDVVTGKIDVRTI